MKKILVPCDFSQRARQAFNFAVELAAASKGEIFVVNMIAAPILYETTFGVQAYPVDASDLKKLEDNAREVFQKMLKLNPVPANVPVKFFPVHDYLIPGVTAFAENNGIDLIVMGTNGSSGLEEIVIGSNTEKIVRFSTVPVIVVHDARIVSSIKNIVLPTTLELNQTEFINRVKDLQEFFKATLHILVVNTPVHFKDEEDAREALTEFVKHYKLENYTTNLRNDQQEKNGILIFAREINADMIAMATHGRQGLSHLFNGSIAESVINHSGCPIWTFSLKKNIRHKKRRDYITGFITSPPRLQALNSEKATATGSHEYFSGDPSREITR